MKSLQWFIRHPFARGIRILYVNWYENPVGNKNPLIQKYQYLFKLIVLKWAKLRGIQVVYVMHNKLPHAFAYDSQIYQKTIKPFMKSSLSTADRIVELSQGTEAYIEKEFDIPNLHKKIRRFRHGMYTKYEQDAQQYREKYGIAKDELVFCFVGKMDQYKNIDIIIKAFYEADIEGKLLLVGKCDESYKDTVLGLIHDDRIIYDFSFVSDEAMSGIMQTVDAIVLPYENTSLNSGIMINAFSNGTTVVGTHIEMLKDFSDDLVYGYDYKTYDEHVHALASALLRAQQDHRQHTLRQKGKQLETLMNTEHNLQNLESDLLNLFK